MSIFKSLKEKYDLIILSPWSGDKDDKRKLRHYNFISAIEKKEDKYICLIVENNFFRFKSKKLNGLNSRIIYVPAFDITTGKNKKIKRLASMILYPLFAILLYIFNGSIRRASDYWVSSPHPGATIVGIFISFLKKTLLYEIRDPWPELPIKTGLLRKGSFIARLFKKIDIVAQKRCANILLTSISYKKYLNEEYKKKCIVMGNSISKELIKSTPHNFLNNNVLHLVFAGGCARAFRMEVVFEAIALALKRKKGLVIQFKLYIDPIEQERFSILVNKFEISESIIFQNKVGYKEMLEAIEKSDFYILHITDDEIFREDINSNKLLDAFTCVKPVIFAANTKLNHIKLSKGGFCSEPDSANKLALSIVEASSLSTKEYASMVNSMENYAMQNLTIEPKVEIINKLFTVNKF